MGPCLEKYIVPDCCFLRQDLDDDLEGVAGGWFLDCDELIFMAWSAVLMSSLRQYSVVISWSP